MDETLATVTPLSRRGLPESDPDPRPLDDKPKLAYWARLQTLREELASLRGAG